MIATQACEHYNLFPEYFAGILNDMNGLVAVASRYQMHGEWTITATDDLMLHLCMITMEFVVTKTQDCEMSAALQVSSSQNFLESMLGL